MSSSRRRNVCENRAGLPSDWPPCGFALEQLESLRRCFQIGKRSSGEAALEPQVPVQSRDDIGDYERSSTRDDSHVLKPASIPLFAGWTVVGARFHRIGIVQMCWVANVDQVNCVTQRAQWPSAADLKRLLISGHACHCLQSRLMADQRKSMTLTLRSRREMGDKDFLFQR